MKRIVVLLLTLFSFILSRSENRDPLILGFVATQTNECEIILYPEVDRFFNAGSKDYVSRIVNTRNCYQTSSGIMFGNANVGGEMSFSLNPSYREAISRIFIQGIVKGNVTPAMTVNGVSKDFGSADNVDVWEYFDIDIADSPDQVISLSSSSKLIIESMTIIFSGSDAAKGDVESVIVPVKNRTMNVGEESMIYSIVSPNYALDKSLNYSSSNDSVATVDSNGLIHANKIGSAAITVSSVSTPSVSTSISVEVVEIKPTAIRFVEATPKVGVGGTYKFELEFTPDNAVKDVEWSTGFTDCIDLNQNGVIKVLRVPQDGSAANVKVTSKVDSNVYKFCPITILESLPVDSITVSPDKIELEVGETIKAQAVVYPRGTSYPNVSWESSDPNVAKVDAEGKITGHSHGNCQISAIAASKDKEVRSPISVKVIEYELSSIEPIINESCNILLQLDGRELKVKGYRIGETLQIYDLEGRCLSSVKLNESETTICLPARRLLIVKIGDSAYRIY